MWESKLTKPPKDVREWTSGKESAFGTSSAAESDGKTFPAMLPFLEEKGSRQGVKPLWLQRRDLQRLRENKCLGKECKYAIWCLKAFTSKPSKVWLVLGSCFKYKPSKAFQVVNMGGRMTKFPGQRALGPVSLGACIMSHTQQEHNLYQFAGRRNGYIPGRETFSENLRHIGGTESVSLPGVPGLTRQVISYLRHMNVRVRAPPGLGPSMAMLIKPEEPCLQSHLQGAVVGHLKDRGCRLKLACVPPFSVTTAIT